MFGMNFRMKLKMLGFIHIKEICLYPQNILHEYKGKSWKGWVLYTCRKFVTTPQMFGTNFGIELKKFYTHPRKMFIPPKCFAWLSGYSWKGWVLYTCQKYVSTPQMFGMNFGIELKMLGFMHIPEVCSHPQIFCTNFGIELKMLGFKIILEICFHPQMFGTNLGKELKILGFFTHPGNMFPAPKCLAQISGGN